MARPSARVVPVSLLTHADPVRPTNSGGCRGSAEAPAFSVGTDVGPHQIGGALERVGVLAGDEQDVAVVGGAHGRALRGAETWQEGFRAHVVVDQRAPHAVTATVGQGAVEQVPVEDHGGAGGELDRNRILFTIAEPVGLPRAVEPGVVLLVVRVEHAGPV